MDGELFWDGGKLGGGWGWWGCGGDVNVVLEAGGWGWCGVEAAYLGFGMRFFGWRGNGDRGWDGGFLFVCGLRWRVCALCGWFEMEGRGGRWGDWLVGFGNWRGLWEGWCSG